MMSFKSNTYGLILCGGSSTRMGTDKSLLTYHNKPQCYHQYDMLQSLSITTFISCKPHQTLGVSGKYQVIIDLPRYESIGPIAALLTAFTYFPQQDLLVVGCDYPYITKDDLVDFSRCCKEEDVAAAFYNEEHQMYEPMLAWYSRRSLGRLMEMYRQKQYSLQYFLKSVKAHAYISQNTTAMTSVDTPESMAAVVEILNKRELVKF